MENVEVKQLAYFNSEEMLAVVASRPTMRESNQPAPDYTKWFRDPEMYYDNFALGFYIDNKMQGFIICKVWSELFPIKIYSRMMWTLPGPSDKHPNGFPKLTSFMLNEQTKFMESKGYYTSYDIIPTKNWAYYTDNEFCPALKRYVRTELETIPAGQMSKFPLFQKHLHVRPYDTELKIRQVVLPEEFRGHPITS